MSLLYEEYSLWKAVHFMDKLDQVKKEGTCAPVSLQISLTNNCNNNCFYCYVSEQNKLQATLETEAVFKLLEEAKEMGIHSVEITGGGEPTLHPDFKKIAAKIKDLGFDLGIVSNGFRIRSDELEHATWIRISIDSFDNEVYKIIRNAKLPDIEQLRYICKNTDVVMGASCVITPYNYETLYEFASTAKEIGFRNVWFKPVEIEGHLNILEPFKEDCLSQFDRVATLVDDSFRVFYPSFRVSNQISCKKTFKNCMQQHLSAFVWSNGDIYPCCSLQGFEGKSMGNIYNDSFKQLWFNRKPISIDECPINCFWSEKNDFINYIMLEKPLHVNFV